MKKAITIIFIVLFFTNCNKGEGDAISELPDISVVDISQESDWDYWVVGKKDYYFVKAKNDLPESVLYHSSETNYDYSIFFTETGLIDKVIVDDFIFVFRNFNGNLLDIGVVHPDGDIQIIGEIVTEYNWDEFAISQKSDFKNKREGVSSWEDVIRFTGRVVAGVPCALSLTAAAGTGGLATPAVLWNCGTYLLALSGDIAANDLKISNGFTDFIETANKSLGAYDCLTGDMYGCASSLSSETASKIAESLNNTEIKIEDVTAVIAALSSGFGDVQVTLTWDNETDLDLHVVDPNGYEVYFDNPSSSYGMTLDVDDIDGIGPENIFWSMQPPSPPGIYRVMVNYFDGTSNSSNYKVIITAFDITKTFSGTISRDQTISIIDLDPLNDWSNKSANTKVVEVSKSTKIKKGSK